MKSRLSILVVSFLFFLIFSFKIEIPLFDFQLGGNDFSKEGHAGWLLYEVFVTLFLIFIGYVGYKNTDNEFIKRFFLAVLIDGFVSLVRHCTFGYYEPFYIAAVSNAIPLSYIIYSYFTYGNRTK